MTGVILLLALALLPLGYQRHIMFATFATAVVTLMLTPIAFRMKRLRMLARTLRNSMSYNNFI